MRPPARASQGRIVGPAYPSGVRGHDGARSRSTQDADLIFLRQGAATDSGAPAAPAAGSADHRGRSGIDAPFDILGRSYRIDIRRAAAMAAVTRGRVCRPEVGAEAAGKGFQTHPARRSVVVMTPAARNRQAKRARKERAC